MQPLDTTAIAHATTRDWDVVVVGAGPAGAIAAHEIARSNRRVLLLDKETFPRSKVCGGCLNQRSLALLRSTSLEDLPRELGGQPIAALKLMAGTRSATVPLRGGVSVSRQAFDASLVQRAVSAGAVFASPVRVTDSVVQHKRRIVTCHSANGDVHQISAKILVVASGLAGRLGSASATNATNISAASRIGAGAITTADDGDFPSGTIHMACGRHGYLGVVRVEAGLLDIAAAVDPAAVKAMGGLGNVVATIANETSMPRIHDIEHLAWHGTPLLTRHRQVVAAERMFVVGDAAGYVEPFTGEGIAWALATGTAVVDFVLEGCKEWNEELALRWHATHRRIVGKRQWLIRGLALALRSRPLTQTLVRTLAVAPALARPFVHWLDAMPPTIHQRSNPGAT